MFERSKVWLALVLSPGALLGCAGQIEASDATQGSEAHDMTPASSVVEGLAAPLVTTFSLSPTRNILLADGKSLCVLTGLRGNFDDWSVTGLNFFDNVWHGGGGGGGGSDAACVPWTAFTRPPGSSILQSDLMSAGVNDGDLFPHYCNRGVDNPNAAGCTDLWWGDSFSFIGGVAGYFNSTNDYVNIAQNPAGDKPSKLYGGSASEVTTGQAYSVVVGAVKRPAMLMGFDANGWKRGSMTSGGTFAFSVSSTAGFDRYLMAPTAKGICALTHLSGSFDGSERITMKRAFASNGEERWRLEATGPDLVRGVSRCLAFDQR